MRPALCDNMLALLDDQPVFREEVRTAWTRAMDGGRLTSFRSSAIPIVTASYEISFHPLFRRGGRCSRPYQFVTDVTERLRREAQLVEAQEALRQAQKMEAMGQLTGGVAHDFNNLLDPDRRDARPVAAQAAGGAREQRLIAGAAQSAERARTLVQRCSPLRGASASADPGRHGPAGGGHARSGRQHTGPQIAVQVDIAPGLPPADVDPNQLEMALLNLSVNARDCDAGGRHAAHHGVTARRGHRWRAGRLYLPVGRRYGSGMDAATLARAIEPFFSTKGVGKGTGLGLSMVHGLASQLGGALDIQSVPGQGTRVALFLPVSGSAPPVAVAGPACAGPAKRSGRVLLVDDEELVRHSNRRHARRSGLCGDRGGLGGGSGPAGRGDTAFDLLVTDHLMPGMSGTDLARLVQARRPGVAILLVSGYAEAEGVEPFHAAPDQAVPQAGTGADAAQFANGPEAMA